MTAEKLNKQAAEEDASTGIVEHIQQAMEQGERMTISHFIRKNAGTEGIKDRPFILYEDMKITNEEYYRECIKYANMLMRLRHTEDKPFHVGLYMENLPEFLKVAGGAALCGAAIVGINTVQRGEYLARDISFSDCQILVTERKFLGVLEPIRDKLTLVPQDNILVNTYWDEDQSPLPFGIPLEEKLKQVGEEMGQAFLIPPEVEVNETDLFMIVFTSGTTSAPKGVLNSHLKMVGAGLGASMLTGFTKDDVAYAAMPLFHSNSMWLAFGPALVQGGAVALIKKFSKSRFLSDVRRYGVTTFNYVGKPLAYVLTTERQPDDHDNPLRVAFGNEASPEHQKEFSERFGCRVIEAFGSSEGGVSSIRADDDPPGSVGKPAPEIKIMNERGEECPSARFDADGKMLNPEEAIGQIVNTGGIGSFEGYYNNPEATAKRAKDNQYHTGDLAYKDEQGYMYFAGRDIEWIRVDGENFLAFPIDEILCRHPSVFLASAYGVPDYDAGDRVMASLLLKEGKEFDPKEFYEFLEEQMRRDMSPKWMPTYICVRSDLPRTETNKVIKRELQRQKFDPNVIKDPIYWRERGDTQFKPFTRDDYQRLKKEFGARGNEHLLEIR